MLTELNNIPPGLLECQATELHEVLSGPTLLHFSGRRKQPLFVSVLLHGNETTGLLAVQKILKKYTAQEFPRALSLFIGNISAARHSIRRLDDQPDYNRVWPGTEDNNSLEARMMQQVVDIMTARNAFASIDIHNNTGMNPHYACVNRLDHRFLQLATLFSRTVVYFLRPHGVQSMAMANCCPAVTLECGKVGEERSLQHAIDYLDACLHLSEIPDHSIAEHDIDLFHTMAQVKLAENASFSFQSQDVDIIFNDDLDRLNFRELPTGTCLGTLRDNDYLFVAAAGENGEDVTQRYFQNQQGRLTLVRSAMPAMLTLDKRVIQQDCIGYLMERLKLSEVLG